MHDDAQLALAVIGAVIVWTTTVAGTVLWLSSKFRSLEITIYREKNKEREWVERQFDIYDKLHQQHDIKIQRLEIRTFGFSLPPIPGTAEPL